LPGYGHPDLMMAMYWVTALLTIASGLNYIFKGFRLMNNE
jgi:hypothetical protein